jgi:hypothetical protein
MDQELRKVIQDCLKPGTDIKRAARRIVRTAKVRGWKALGMSPCGLNQSELIREIAKVHRQNLN